MRELRSGHPATSRRNLLVSLMLPRGNFCKTQRPTKLRKLSTENGTRYRPKLSQLSAVKANNRALATALDDSKQLCSKLKDENLCLRRERQELCETVSNLRLQLQTQQFSVQAVIDQLTSAQQGITQAKTFLTSGLVDKVHMSLSPVAMGGGVTTSSGRAGVGCSVEADEAKFLSPPGHTSSPNGSTGEDGHTSLPSGPAGHDGNMSSLSGPAEQYICPLIGGAKVPFCITGEVDEGRSPVERGGLTLDLMVEEEEGVNSNSILTHRPKRKCAPLSSSMVEPSLRDKLRRGDPFTTSFNTWSPCDRKEKSKSKKRYPAKRIPLANITNKC